MSNENRPITIKASQSAAILAHSHEVEEKARELVALDTTRFSIRVTHQAYIIEGQEHSVSVPVYSVDVNFKFADGTNPIILIEEHHDSRVGKPTLQYKLSGELLRPYWDTKEYWQRRHEHNHERWYVNADRLAKRLNGLIGLYRSWFKREKTEEGRKQQRIKRLVDHVTDKFPSGTVTHYDPYQYNDHFGDGIIEVKTIDGTMAFNYTFDEDDHIELYVYRVYFSKNRTDLTEQMIAVFNGTIEHYVKHRYDADE